MNECPCMECFRAPNMEVGPDEAVRVQRRDRVEFWHPECWAMRPSGDF